jgi:hypothetical protein
MVNSEDCRSIMRIRLDRLFKLMNQGLLGRPIVLSETVDSYSHRLSETVVLVDTKEFIGGKHTVLALTPFSHCIFGKTLRS